MSKQLAESVMSSVNHPVMLSAGCQTASLIDHCSQPPKLTY